MTNAASQQEAQQLDSVTDMVQEQDTVDGTKALQAMSGGAGGATRQQQQHHAQQQQQAQQTKISQDDIDLIMAELEVTEECAIKTLREVAATRATSGGSNNSNAATAQPSSPLVVEALRKLVTS